MSATTSGAKSKFFGFFKGLFQKPDQNGAAAEEPAATPRTQSPPTPAAAARPARNGNGNGAPASHRGAPSLSITLSGIINALPTDLRAKVKQPDVGDLTVSVALEKILPQLSHGAVKVPFGDIRQAAPQVFAGGAESDRIAVMLPLNEVLTQLNPALLVRRPAQKQVEVPSEISSPFDAKGQGLVFSVGNAKPVSPAAPRQAVPAPATPARGAISSVPTPKPPPATASIPMARKAPAPAATPPPAQPAVPPSQPIAFAPIPSSRATTPARPAITPADPPDIFTPKAPAAAPSPIPMPAPARPSQTPGVPPDVFTPKHAAATPAPIPAPATPGMTRPTLVGQPAQPVLPPASAANVERLEVPLKALAETWPEAIRQEIVRMRLLDACVLLPCDAVESGLRSGRAAFAWKSLRSWLQPAPLEAASPNDQVEVELPLKVVTPLFFARKKEVAKPAHRVTIDEGIPNLFFGFPGAETAPAAVAPSALASPEAKAGPVTKPVDTNYYVWDDSSDTVAAEESEYKRKTPGGTDFVARYATPNEIVSRAAAVEGVAGALIALPDGLMVASRIPSELNGDTLAAFLPQIFAKVNQCTRELRMGELNNLNFTVGNVPWKIFRVNAIFFAAFGRAGEPLPTAALAALAAELDRKQK
jgi:predicted regulator of Ras-like GTPase activity (Roadblock/LC7/MglB family)